MWIDVFHALRTELQSDIQQPIPIPYGVQATPQGGLCSLVMPQHPCSLTRLCTYRQGRIHSLLLVASMIDLLLRGKLSLFWLEPRVQERAQSA